MINQRLTVFHQLFSWTSSGSPKSPFDKMIVRKAIWQSEEFPDYPMYRLRAPSLKIFSKGIIFQITFFKKVHCPLSKFSLHSLTAFWAAFHQLISQTLKMSNQQKDWFARPSESQSNSFNTMCTIWELHHTTFWEVIQI